MVTIRARAAVSRRVALAAAWMVLTLDASALAQSPEEVAAGGLDARFDRVAQMIDAVDALPEWDRDGLLFRVDEEILALHDELAKLTETLPQKPEGAAPEGTAPHERLSGWLDRALALSSARIVGLGQRIDTELATYDEFSNATDTIISRAFVQDLRRIRLRHLAAALDQIDSREALGLPAVTEVRRQLEDGLDLAAERLVGQIRLDAMTLEELRRGIAADPAEESLRSALRAVERKQTGNLDTVSGVVALLSRMGRDTTVLRALQAQQRGLIGAEIFDADVFLSLMNDRLEMAREKFVLAGPVWTLRLLAFVSVLIIAWLVARGARELVHRITLHRSVELGDLRERTLVSLAYSAVLLVGVVLALSALGVSLVPLLAGLGVASIIVGLALQESLGNLAAGGMILITRPFDLHDRIRVGNAEGKVKDMSLVATTVASHDNKILVIPNRQVWSSTITNFTRAKVRRVDVEVSIPNDSDLAGVERLLRECIDAEERILNKPSPLVHFGDIGESKIAFWVRGWVQTADVDPVTIALKRSIAERLRETGVESGVQTG
jgi:small conductance mechanosensitive channel